jgi:DNA polymerase III delta prime subunit
MGSIIQLAKVAPPECLNDFALQSSSRQWLEAIVDQTMQFPSHGICGIIFHGLHGTGKTTLAHLMPGLIESARSTNVLKTALAGEVIDTLDTPYDSYACASSNNSTQLISTINNRTILVPPTKSNLHYIVLDELDNLTDLAQASLKAIMNRTTVVFFMTTNHLHKIDLGIQNRSILIDMNVPPPKQWRPILRKVYTDAGLSAPNNVFLDQTVLAGRGSARSIFTDITMSANQCIRNGERRVAANDEAKEDHDKGDQS